MMFRSRLFCMALAIAVACVGWLVVPSGLEPASWRLLTIFMGTILLVVLDTFPIGACALFGLTAAVSLRVVSFEEAFIGYHKSVVWLVLSAFFISHAVVKTGLGKRLACYLICLLGKSPLGLAYSITLTDTILAPAVPSATARSGGVVFPIVRSLAGALGLKPQENSQNGLGAYLMLVGFHATVISSTLFLTAMASNPFAAQLAKEVGVHITWSTWALTACVPGVISLLLMPLLLFILTQPANHSTNHARTMAHEKLKQMGAMTFQEKLVVVALLFLLSLWTMGPWFHITATQASLMGVVLLLLLRVLSWSDITGLASAWGTFIWFGAFLSFASNLSHNGVAAWFAQGVSTIVQPLSPTTGFGVLCLLFFYAHYVIGSSTAHVGALYPPFLLAAIHLGTPPLYAALFLAWLASLAGCLTHYSFGPAPIWFAAGFVPLQRWCWVGFLLSIFHLLTWGAVGTLWWRFLGA
ncbi:MAG: DASS family sodium-coupled anion symporter [Myxococcota bacterium]